MLFSCTCRTLGVLPANNESGVFLFNTLSFAEGVNHAVIPVSACVQGNFPPKILSRCKLFSAGATLFASPIAVAEQRQKTHIFPLQFAGTRQEALDHPLQIAGTRQEALDHLLQIAGTRQEALDHLLQIAGTCQEALDHLLQIAGTLQEALGHSLQFARVNSVKKDHLNKFLFIHHQIFISWKS
ncbi:MAG: short coiled-coil protein [Bacteroidales bacterium]|jgi:hypothetical protein|nr:short coiled-coil protein [Bacteroidales bacterium]